MDDKFLNDMRRDPDPGFARSLRARLRRLEGESADAPRGFRWAPVFATAAAAAFVVATFTVPSVRAFAQAALDLFRVQEFAIVQVDPARLEQLKNARVDMSALVGGKVETLQEQLPPQRFATLDEAGAVLGETIPRPSVLPRGMTPDSVFVRSESRSRVTVDTQPVRELVRLLDLRDVEVPTGLDGKQLTIHMPRMVSQTFRRNERTHATLLQGASPEVELPPGVDLARFGEVGLRLLGMSDSEARRLAGSIDWRNTLVVPMLAGATQYQQVRVQGQPGLYMEIEGGEGDSGRSGDGRVVLWTQRGRVHVLMGQRLERSELMTMAESVR